METEGHPKDPEDFMRCVDAQPQFPSTYTENYPEEEHLLYIAQRFQRHFSLLYPDRRPLLLYAQNECGVKKLVPTTLRPTFTTQPDVFTWQECANFVSNILTLQPLDPPTELPSSLRSPQTVLCSQWGTSLEYATLLCSLLLGFDYNAYCVSGYASKHLCELDRSLECCPLLEEPHMLLYPQDPVQEPQDEESKYNMKKKRKLHSDFLLKQEQKLKQQQLSQSHSDPGPSPAPDPLQGLRVHFWVLVLAGCHGVENDFLIEPLSGNPFPLQHPHFLGVESVWNDLNVYVNMQNCANGCQDLVWDPEDQTHWELLIYGTTSKKQLQAEVLKRLEKLQLDQNEEAGPAYSFDMPLSWCSMIEITDRDLEMCWPGGFKVTHFKDALLENFIPYFCPDGVVTRLTLYKDPHKTQVQTVREWFQNRVDLLMYRETSGGFTKEFFRRGRSSHLIFHRFSTSVPEACPAASDPSVTPEREMCFAPYRVDRLVRMLERGNQMVETFQRRKDFLFQRRTVFELPTVSKQAAGSDIDKDDARPIVKVVEEFHRNPSKAASEDIAECVFLLAESCIEVTYHLEENAVIAAKRSFILDLELENATNFTEDMLSPFKMSSQVKPLTLPQLHELLLRLIKKGQKIIPEIRNSQRLVQLLVQRRAKEQEDVLLNTSPWTTPGTTLARKHRKRAMLLGEEMRWLEQQQKDLLAPVLRCLNGTTDLSPDQAQTTYQDCLKDFRSCMVQHACLIQQCIDEDTRDVEQEREKQERQEQEREKMVGKKMAEKKLKMGTPRRERLERERQESEQERKDQSPDQKLNDFYVNKMWQIQMAQERLQMHKECAPQKYRALEQHLRADPRLRPHLKDK